MMELGDKKGICIFIGLLLLVTVVALAAYQLSGTMGIEERFNHAVGLGNGEAAGEGNGWFGLGLEGSLLPYGIILFVLALGVFILYRNFPM